MLNCSTIGSSAATPATKDNSLKRVRSLSRLSHRWGRNKPRIVQDAATDEARNPDETAPYVHLSIIAK